MDYVSRDKLLINSKEYFIPENCFVLDIFKIYLFKNHVHFKLFPETKLFEHDNPPLFPNFTEL